MTRNVVPLEEMKFFFLQVFLSGISIEAVLDFQDSLKIANAKTYDQLEARIKDKVESLFNKKDEIKSQYNKQLIKKAINYIENNLNKELSLETIASYVHLSPFYFSRQFKSFTGLNLVKYINNLRIKKSMEQLEKSTLSINSISRQCGYKNPNYFCKVFKKNTGFTPMEWRANSGRN